MKRFTRGAERIISVLFILLIVLFVFNLFSNRDKSDTLYNKLKSEKADLAEDVYTTELNHSLSKLATDLDLFVYTIKTTDNYIFDDEDFRYFDMYADFVIYGDDTYRKANDLEYKLENVSMMVGVINYHIKDINTFIYSLGKNKTYYSFLWQNIYNDIRAVNNDILNYTKNTGYDLPKVNSMGEINRDTIKEAKSRWEAIEGAKFPQGSIE